MTRRKRPAAPIALCACLALLLSAPRARAIEPPEPVEGCALFDHTRALDRRRDQWREAIERAAKEDPDAIYAWATGRRRPPEHVVAEAKAQRDCMLRALISDAARPETDLVLTIAHDGWADTKRGMAALERALTSGRARLTETLGVVTRSHWRGAPAQARIWRRKLTFRRARPFNLISERAARACALRAGDVWRPAKAKHRACWRSLAPRARQREVLSASSAPGISRHHWGTDFDLFGLNPRDFADGAKLADEYAWMQRNAARFGFIQPFLGPKRRGAHTYIEERWHWSYYPIAAALRSHIAAHPEAMERALEELWTQLEARWHRRRPDDSFGYLREVWRAYVLGVAGPPRPGPPLPPIRAERAISSR